MAKEMLHGAVALALALSGVAACGGDSRMPPQTPTDLTATTGATASDRYVQPSTTAEPHAAPDTPQNAPGARGIASSAKDGAAGVSASDATALADADIASIARAASEVEIEQAQHAMKHAKSARVALEELRAKASAHLGEAQAIQASLAANQ